MTKQWQLRAAGLALALAASAASHAQILIGQTAGFNVEDTRHRTCRHLT